MIDYDENLDTLASVYFTGLGGGEISEILLFLNLPNAASFERTYTRYISYFTDIIRSLVMEEIEHALDDEIEATLCAEKGEEYYSEWMKKDINERDKVGLTVSYDRAWQKKSSGRKYDSRSGHAFLGGSMTRKIVGCVVFSKNCKQCEINIAKRFPNTSIINFEEKEQVFIAKYLKNIDNKWKATQENVPFVDTLPSNPNNAFGVPYIHPLDVCQIIEPSQITGQVLDVTTKDHKCVRNFSGSSGSMESNGLLYLSKGIYTKRKGTVFFLKP